MEAQDLNRNLSESQQSVAADFTVIDNPFSRANVCSNEEKVRLVDKDEETGLDLFCYVRCSNNDDEFVKNCRGLVYHGDKLVMKAFPYTSEYSHTDLENLKSIFSNMSDWTFFKAYEGALIRMFYFSGRWYISTHRKLNAFRSKWSSKESFGNLFKKALEVEYTINSSFKERVGDFESEDPNEFLLSRFETTLDKNKQYMFLLRNNNDNRIVCQAPVPFSSKLFHVGTFQNGELVDDNVAISKPEKLTFGSLGDALEFIDKKIDIKHNQGVIAFSNNNTQVKILHDEYLQLSRVRGNEPSIKFRYLQVRMNKKLTEQLYNLYPESKVVFDEYEKILYDIAQGIYRAYIQRFIKKNYITVPQEEYQVVKACHAWHLCNKLNNKISIDRVIKTLNEQAATNLNHMIHRYKIEQTKKDNTVPRTIKSSRFNTPAIGSVNASALINKVSNMSLN